MQNAYDEKTGLITVKPAPFPKGPLARGLKKGLGLSDWFPLADSPKYEEDSVADINACLDELGALNSSNPKQQ